MQFESWAAFFAMGGYGLYVWLSVAVCVATMAALHLGARQQTKRLQRRVVHLHQRKRAQREVHMSPPVPKAGQGHLRTTEPGL